MHVAKANETQLDHDTAMSPPVSIRELQETILYTPKQNSPASSSTRPTIDDGDSSQAVSLDTFRASSTVSPHTIKDHLQLVSRHL